MAVRIAIVEDEKVCRSRAGAGDSALRNGKQGVVYDLRLA